MSEQDSNQQSKKVTVTVTGTTGTTVNCVYNPNEKYKISNGSNYIKYELDQASKEAGWLFTGKIEEDDNKNQLSAETQANQTKLRVKDINSEAGIISYKLQLTKGGTNYWTTDPQNDNDGTGCPP